MTPVNPDAIEICNGIDDNCDGTVDEGCGCTDADGDGYCVPEDCDDDDFYINPGVAEICGDLIDNNCDGSIDEGCSSCLPAGEPCITGSECCSLRCHPRKLTCK